MSQNQPLEVLIVEDHPMMASSVTSYLQTMHINVRSVVVRSIAQAKKWLAKRDRPILIIADLNLPDSIGLETLKELRDLAPLVPIMVFSMDDDPGTERAVLTMGAKSFVSKSSLPEHFIRQIKAHLASVVEQPVTEYSSKSKKDEHPVASLTPRQQAVLAEVASGYSNREMAQRLRISEETIHSHLSEIFQRLGVQNRTQASIQYLTWAQKHGLVA
jgi:two-component system nitrate/nitrite response regulator NarP